MIISQNLERETAVDGRSVRLIVRTFESTCSQQGLVSRIEGYRAEFLPVAYDRFFCQDLVQRNLAL